MHGAQPALGGVLLVRLAGDRAPLGGVVDDLAGGRGHPDDLGAGLHQGAVALLLAADRGLGEHAVGDVHDEEDDTGDLAVGGVRRKPAVRPVPPADLQIDVERRTVFVDDLAHGGLDDLAELLGEHLGRLLALQVGDGDSV